MNKVPDFIPKGKGDFEAIEVLKKTAWDEVLPYADLLLEWVQDINWPVAGDVARVLAPHVNSIKNNIIAIFRTNDELWKYWCIRYVIYWSDEPEMDIEILSELKRLAADLSEDEDVREAAEEALKDRERIEKKDQSNT